MDQNVKHKIMQLLEDTLGLNQDDFSYDDGFSWSDMKV